MKLLSSPTSPFGRKVRIMLLEKGIPHEVVNPWQPSSGLELARHNPLGKVPALLLDDGALFDSVVIAEYLDALPQGPKLIPNEPWQRALVRRWEAVADGIAEAAVAIMLERRRAEPLRDATLVERQLGKIRQALAFVEPELGPQGFAHGTEFSLADAALASALGYLDLRVAEEPWRERHPALARYAAALDARPSIRETSPPKT
jgi:glutathione S-transferase